MKKEKKAEALSAEYLRKTHFPDPASIESIGKRSEFQDPIVRGLDKAMTHVLNKS